ncbi:hypothetical protein ABTD53_19300, partial [Acinetobacter baumannii]
EPFARLPDRIELYLPEYELVLRGLELLGDSDDPAAPEAASLYQAVLSRIWPELGTIDEGI